MQKNERIKTLNDFLRKNALGGDTVITQGVQSLSHSEREQLLQQIRHFDDFTEDNDPYDQHDFGSITLFNTVFFWKIDYYDENRRYLSPDPADPKKTCRVLTIMLSEEY